MANLDLLLDTHVALWFLSDSKRLSKKARRVLADPENHLSFSAGSIWEIGLKRALGRADFTYDPIVVRRTLLSYGHREVALTGLQAQCLAELPRVHRDPFDRILLAQALSEGLTLLTSDKQLAKYPGKILVV